MTSVLSCIHPYFLSFGYSLYLLFFHTILLQPHFAVRTGKCKFRNRPIYILFTCKMACNDKCFPANRILSLRLGANFVIFDQLLNLFLRNGIPQKSIGPNSRSILPFHRYGFLFILDTDDMRIQQKSALTVPVRIHIQMNKDS